MEICTVGSVRGENLGAAMADLNGHEAGNGGYSQGRPTAREVLLYSERCPVTYQDLSRPYRIGGVVLWFFQREKQKLGRSVGLSIWILSRGERRVNCCSCLPEWLCALASRSLVQAHYFLSANGGPLTRFPLRATFTSTRLAILIKGMPLFIP